MSNSGDFYALKDILGHKTIAMTQRYAHLSPAYKRSMVERMEKIWARPVQPPAAPERLEAPPHRLARHNRVTKAVLAASR